MAVCFGGSRSLRSSGGADRGVIWVYAGVILFMYINT